MMNTPLRCVAVALLVGLGVTSTAFAQDKPIRPVAADQKPAKPAKLNINKATAAELAAVGVDADTAKKILAKRPFTKLTDLEAILPQGMLAKIEPKIALDDGSPVTADANAGRGVRTPKIDVNQATAKDLTKLPGIDLAIAENIIAKRPYKTVDALVAAVPANILARIKPLVCVDATANPDGTIANSDGQVAPVKADINKAAAAELEGTLGIAAAIAQKIIAGRPYQTVGDLAVVVDAQELAKIKPLIVIDGTEVWVGPPLRASFENSGRLVIVLTAPTGGYAFKFDDTQSKDGVATVRCTMTTPGVGEVTTDALEDHTVEVTKFPEGATSVVVAVATAQRGAHYLVAPTHVPAVDLAMPKK
ncbi:MAG: helix-hairpin-helix domain-containing protein [Planctomycetota bacterium]